MENNDNDNLQISDNNTPEPDNIRIIGGKKYQVVKTPCTCVCHHKGVRVMHIRACCDNGWKSRLELIKE